MGNDETVINQVVNRYSRAHNLIPATALSRVGSIAYTVVVAWYVSQHAGNQMVGLMNALNGAGVLLASILGFTIIDRYNKKTLLIAYDIINRIFFKRQGISVSGKILYFFYFQVPYAFFMIVAYRNNICAYQPGYHS